MSVTGKESREHIARARAASQKGDLLRCLGCLRDAVHGLIDNKVFGREKFEIESLLVEALRDLNGMRTMQRVLPAGVTYVRGQERKLYNKIALLHKKLKEAIERARVEKLRARMLSLDEGLLEAQAHLKAKEHLEARKIFRRMADQFEGQPGLLSDIGTRLLMGGLVQEAVEYLRKGLEENPRDERAHASLIMCYEVLGLLDKVEESIKSAIRLLGGREDLHIRLAKVYLTRRNWSSALNIADAVLKQNPLNAEARKIRNQARPKVYGPGGGPAKRAASAAPVTSQPQHAPQAAASATVSSEASAAPKKPIKLDF
ncbi:MAG: tetratricopeptide repeat protein [Desulfovibrionaceae bacterium]